MVFYGRRFASFQVIFTSFVLVCSLLLFFKIGFDLKKFSQRTNQEIVSQSYELIQRMKMANLSNFSLSTQNKDEATTPVSAAWYLGKNKIWSYPKDFIFPQFTEQIGPLGEIVVISSAQRMFLSKVEDGRTAVIIFTTKEYKNIWNQSVLTSFLAFLVGAFGIFFLFATLNRFKSVGEIQNSGVLSKQKENPVDALLVVKKTIADLREKNLLLETELRKEKKKAKGISSVLENLSSTLNAGFIRFDSDGNLQSFNPIAKNLIGLPILFRVGENFTKMFAKNPSLLQFIQNSIEKREISTIDEVKGLKEKLLFIISIPILDNMSHFEGILLIIEDKSEFYSWQKIMKEKEALSRLGEVAAGVTHEIRNGLNVLSGELRLLKKDFPQSFEERTKRIESEIGQMEKVVKDLLYYAKPITIQKERINSYEFLTELTNSLKELFPKTTFTYEVECESFIADRDSLFRALFNLLKNGAESAKEGGEVFIYVRKLNSSVEFHIEDSGEGIPKEISDNIFTLFTSYKKEGTGLGLPIAKKIARENGGDLYISKSTKLQGAAFDFIISLEEVR